MVTVRELFAGYDATIEGADVEVCALSCDSRRVTAGTCFAALVGERADGHGFVSDAVGRGATSVLCQRPVEAGAATRVLVRDARLALAHAARRFFAEPSGLLTMVGITGTSGKTTTSYVVEGILQAAGLRPGVIGTLGFRYGAHADTTGLTTPESVDVQQLLRRMLDDGAGSVVMEVSSHALSQHRVAGVDYDIGVFMNLSHEHLDYHRTLEAYFEAKSTLIRQRLKSGGRAVVNYDDAHGRRLADATAGTVTFSVAGDPGAVVRVVREALTPAGSELELATARGPLRLHSCLLGHFNTENIVAAASVGEALGIDPAVIAAGVAAVKAVPGRLERVSRQGQPLVLIDYAHKPDALEKALRAVRELTHGRLLCVFGCGGDRDRSKRPIMGRVAAELADWTIVTNDNPRSEAPADIAAAIEAGLRAANAVPAASPQAQTRGYAIEPDRARAIRLAIATAGPDDTVLVAGKGHETYQISGGVTRPFDDRQEARAALREIARGVNP